MKSGYLIRAEEDHGRFTDLYRASQLEISDDWVRENGACCSFAARDGARLLGAATVSWRFGRYVLDYIAVEPGLRGSGLGRKLTEACLQWCREQGAKEVYLAARTPAFFRAIGGFESGGTVLLQECLSCPDYGKDCSPVEMVLKTV